MQSLTQWRHLNRRVREQVQTEKKIFSFHQSTSINSSSPNTPGSITQVAEIQEPQDPESSERILQHESAITAIPSNGNVNGANFSQHLAQHIPGIVVINENEETKSTSFLVESASDDRSKPRNWPNSRRIPATIIVFCIVLVCGWASSANSSSNKRAAAALHISTETESLATAIFLFGIGIGALASGPISETAGRNPSYLIFMFLYMVMVLITALVPNAAVQLVFRFLAGLFASPPLTIYGGSLADMYDNVERSLVWPFFALSPILGPVLAPVAGGWLVQSYNISWRWVDWLTLILSGVVFLVALIFLPETFSPMILQWKATSLRHFTGDTRFRSSHELQDPFLARLKTNITRPVAFFTREPIVIFIGLYLTLIYVLVFTFLDGFTYIFVDTYGFSPGLRGTAFLAIALGAILNTMTAPLFRRNYLKRLEKAQEALDGDESETGRTIEPEIRLLPALISAPLFPISLFWLGWTNYASITPWSDLIAACLFGFSLMGIFASSYQYVMDSYETYSASALSSITFLRYMVAGGMVIADMPMYKGIGVHWTLTLMGCLSLMLVPVPFLFWRYGCKIRAKSEFATSCE